MVVRVRDEHEAVRRAHPAGLVELGNHRRAVPVTCRSATQQSHRLALQRVDLLHLVVVGVRYIQRAVLELDALDVLQPHVVSEPVPVAEGEQVLAHYRADAPRGVEVRSPHRARLAVSEVEPHAVARHAVRLGQLSGRLLAVDDALAPAPGVGADAARGELHPPQLVEPRHRDIQRPIVKLQVPRGVQVCLQPRRPRDGRASPVGPFQLWFLRCG